MTAQYWLYFFLAVSEFSLIVAFFFARQVNGSDQGTPEIRKIAGAIKKGAEVVPQAPLQDGGGPSGPAAASRNRRRAGNTRRRRSQPEAAGFVEREFSSA